MPKINAERLKKRRSEMGLSLDQLAERARVGRTTIHRIEAKKTGRQSMTTAKRLAESLGLSTAQLLGDGAMPVVEGSDSQRARLNVRIAPDARNALAFVAHRYRVPAANIIELAPLMFHILAGESLQRRHKALDEIEETRTMLAELRSAAPHLTSEATDTWRQEKILRAEAASIDALDIVGQRMLDDWPWDGPGPSYEDQTSLNPFVVMLRERLKALPDEQGWEGDVTSWLPGLSPDFRICRTEALAYCGGRAHLAERMLGGSISIQDVPQEMRKGSALEARVEWLEARHNSLMEQEAKAAAELDELLALALQTPAQDGSDQ